MITRITHTTLAVLSLGALTACHPPATRAVAGSAADVASPAGATRVSEARLAGIALMVNNIEIGYALLAPGRAADRDVTTYAERLRTDHTSLNASLTDLLALLDIPAEDDPAGLALRDVSAARRARLQELSGRAFDVAWVQADLASHRELLDVIDRVLVPSATRRELRDYVSGLRPAVAAHIAHAEQLSATLAARRQ